MEVGVRHIEQPLPMHMPLFPAACIESNPDIRLLLEAPPAGETSKATRKMCPIDWSPLLNHQDFPPKSTVELKREKDFSICKKRQDGIHFILRYLDSDFNVM